MSWEQQLALTFNFLNNAALPAIGTVGYCYLRRRFEKDWPAWIRPVLYGALFGGLGILTSLAPAMTTHGVPISLRNTVTVIATLYCGIAAGAVSALFQAWYAAYVQMLGPVIPAVFGITFALSAIYRRALFPDDRRPKHGGVVLLAIVSALASLAILATFRDPAAVRDALMAGGPAWGIMYVLTILALSAIIQHIERSRALADAAAENERRFRSFYDEAPVMMTAIGLDGRFVAVSDRWLDFMGYRREEVIGRNRYDFLVPSSAETIRDRAIPALAKGGSLPEIDLQIVRKDGTVVDVAATLVLRRDPGTGEAEILSLVVDQTARREAERALAEREGDLQAIMDNAPFGIFLKDRLGRYRMMNRTYADWFNERPEDVIGRTTSELYTPEIAEPIDANDREVFETGRVSEWERKVCMAKPGIEDILVTKFPIADETGAVAGLAVFISDITARKRSERALTENWQLLLESQRLGKLGYILTDLINDRVTWSDSLFDLRKVEKRHSFSFEETIEFIHPEDRARFLAERSRALAERRNYALEVRVRRGDGSIGWERAFGHPRYDEAGECTSVLSVLRDVTEEKLADEALRRKDADLRAIMDNAPFAIFLKDNDERYRLINRTYTDWFGDRAEDVIGRRAADLYPAELVRQWETMDEEITRTGQIAQGERRVLSARPGIEHILTTKFPIRDEQGAMIGFAGIVVDITARKQAEESLRHSEERFRALIEHSSDMVTVVAEDGTVTYRSPSNLEVLGLADSEVVGKSILEGVHADDAAEIMATLRSLAADPKRHATGRSRVRHGDGSWRTIAWSARAATDVPGIEGIIVNSRDVTQAQVLEDRLHEAQKMEAVGRLAGGIAHDFNNILGAILGFANFLLQDLATASPEHRFAERIVAAGERGKELVRQILTFARRGGVDHKPTNLGELVKESRELLRASLPSSTRLVLTVKDEGLVADVNPAQISQVMMNLCLNANDALMGEPGTTAITVTRATPADLERALAARPAAGVGAGAADDVARVAFGSVRPEQAYACIAVADTGAGMPAELLKHIFDPFFTTKERGRGTGLGLAVVHGIVMSYDGVLLVTSRPGSGSAFEIYLPLADAPVAAAPLPRTARTSLRGRERVLVIDDEVAVADVMAIGLDRLGYEAVAAHDPSEALAAFEEDPAAFDVVVSDQVMPRMKGLALFRSLKAIRPSLRFILCTGFSDEATEESARATGVDAYFMKPAAPEEIAAAIRQLFDAPVKSSQPMS
jgi:PAS domain S-box-containing protein